VASKVRVPFGKYKGDRIGDIPSSYIVYLLEEDGKVGRVMRLEVAMRNALITELLTRFIPHFQPPRFVEQEPTRAGRPNFNSNYYDEPRPTPPPRSGYDPHGVFNDEPGPRVGTHQAPPSIPKDDYDAVAVMREIVEAGFKAIARKAHPDAGGTHERMTRVNRAVEMLRKALSLRSKNH